MLNIIKCLKENGIKYCYDVQNSVILIFIDLFYRMSIFNTNPVIQAVFGTDDDIEFKTKQKQYISTYQSDVDVIKKIEAVRALNPIKLNKKKAIELLNNLISQQNDLSRSIASYSTETYYNNRYVSSNVLELFKQAKLFYDQAKLWKTEFEYLWPTETKVSKITREELISNINELQEKVSQITLKSADHEELKIWINNSLKYLEYTNDNRMDIEVQYTSLQLAKNIVEENYIYLDRIDSCLDMYGRKAYKIHYKNTEIREDANSKNMYKVCLEAQKLNTHMRVFHEYLFKKYNSNLFKTFDGEEIESELDLGISSLFIEEESKEIKSIDLRRFLNQDTFHISKEEDSESESGDEDSESESGDEDYQCLYPSPNEFDRNSILLKLKEENFFDSVFDCIDKKNSTSLNQNSFKKEILKNKNELDYDISWLFIEEKDSENKCNDEDHPCFYSPIDKPRFDEKTSTSLNQSSASKNPFESDHPSLKYQSSKINY